ERAMHGASGDPFSGVSVAVGSAQASRAERIRALRALTRLRRQWPFIRAEKRLPQPGVIGVASDTEHSWASHRHDDDRDARTKLLLVGDRLERNVAHPDREANNSLPGSLS